MALEIDIALSFSKAILFDNTKILVVCSDTNNMKKYIKQCVGFIDKYIIIKDFVTKMGSEIKFANGSCISFTIPQPTQEHLRGHRLKHELYGYDAQLFSDAVLEQAIQPFIKKGCD